ncbi:MAG: hypothetical protein SF051_05685 [Elusimicrobiota bacterium]|nr:hypothetical protein [Elusimicrobiota bacterium]
MRRVLLTAAALAAAVYAMALGDVVLRGRSAYLEGEKWLEWSRRPELKKAHFDAVLAEREKALAKEKPSLAPEAYEKKLALARFERDQAVAESSLKYAFVWYRTAVELFTPPETRWTRAARERLAETRELWRAELTARGVKVADHMLE